MIDWRSTDLPYKVRDFLSIWDMGKYWYADTIDYKEITNFVAIDDMDLSLALDKHFVKTYNVINDEQMKKCIEILNSNDLIVNSI